LISFFLPEKKNREKKRKNAVSSLRTLWRQDVVKGLLIFRFSNAVVRGSTTAFLPVFASRLTVSPSQIGFLVSLNILLTAVLQYFLGKLADRWSRAGLIVMGNLMTAVPLLLTPFAQNLSHLIVLSVCMGVGGGVAFPAALAVATVAGRDHGMGNIMGYFNAAMSYGMIFGPIVSGWIMDLLGLSVVFMFGGFIGVLGTIVCVYFMIHKQGVGVHADV
jgi:MFS family permease